MQVSGSIAPDVTGTYTYNGQVNGQPSWGPGPEDFYIWYSPDKPSYVLSNTIPVEPGALDEWWLSNTMLRYGLYDPMDGGSGDVTVTLAS